MVRGRTKTFTNPLITDALLVKEVSLAVQKWAKILNGATAPFYLKTVGTAVITGTANPYTVDLSAFNPFIDKLIKVVHKTAVGVRTFVDMKTPYEAETVQGMTSFNSSTIFGVFEGDSIKLYKGSGFTITTATDTVEVQFYRQPIVSTAVTPTVISDTAFTAAADGLTISAFTGTIAGHVGGTFVGLDFGGNAFARTINGYVSATSFTIAGTPITVGAGTNGYIIPPLSASVGTGAYPDIPDSFIPTIVTEVVSNIKSYTGDNSNFEMAELKNDRDSVLQAYGMSNPNPAIQK